MQGQRKDRFSWASGWAGGERESQTVGAGCSPLSLGRHPLPLPEESGVTPPLGPFSKEHHVLSGPQHLLKQRGPGQGGLSQPRVPWILEAGPTSSGGGPSVEGRPLGDPGGAVGGRGPLGHTG